jgi:hypothetical protein
MMNFTRLDALKSRFNYYPKNMLDIGANLGRFTSEFLTIFVILRIDKKVIRSSVSGYQEIALLSS